MQDRPTAAEAIDAVTELLRDELLPGADAEHRFQLRVAVNLLGIVERELRDGPALERAERERLVALFESNGRRLEPSGERLDPGSEPLDPDRELLDLNRELARRLREGEIDWHSRPLLDHLRRTAEDRVRVANPRYLTSTKRLVD